MQHFNYPPGMGRDYSAPSPVADNPPFPAPPVQSTWQTRLNSQVGSNQNAPGYAAPAQLPQQAAPAPAYSVPMPQQQPAPAPGYGAPSRPPYDPASGYAAPAPNYGAPTPAPQAGPATSVWQDLIQRWQQMSQPAQPPRRLFMPRAAQQIWADTAASGYPLPAAQQGQQQQQQQQQNPYGTPDNRGAPVASRANLGSNHLNTWQQRLAGGQAGGPGKQPRLPQSRY